MPAKKQYPRNEPLQVSVSDIEKQAIIQAAKDEGVSVNKWMHEAMWRGNLRSTVAFYFPDDAPKMEQERTA